MTSYDFLEQCLNWLLETFFCGQKAIYKCMTEISGQQTSCFNFMFAWPLKIPWTFFSIMFSLRFGTQGCSWKNYNWGGCRAGGSRGGWYSNPTFFNVCFLCPLGLHERFSVSCFLCVLAPNECCWKIIIAEGGGGGGGWAHQPCIFFSGFLFL